MNSACSQNKKKVGALKILTDKPILKFYTVRVLLTNQISIHDEIKYGIKAGKSCYYSVQTLLVF